MAGWQRTEVQDQADQIGQAACMHTISSISCMRGAGSHVAYTAAISLGVPGNYTLQFGQERSPPPVADDCQELTKETMGMIIQEEGSQQQ